MFLDELMILWVCVTLTVRTACAIYTKLDGFHEIIFNSVTSYNYDSLFMNKKCWI